MYLFYTYFIIKLDNALDYDILLIDREINNNSSDGGIIMGTLTKASSNKTLYLDWVNNFLTIEGFAKHYGMSYKVAFNIVNTKGQTLDKD